MLFTRVVVLMLVVVSGATAHAAPPESKPSGTQIRDAAGDWPIAAQDILGGGFADGQDGLSFSGVLRLAARPAQPTSYELRFSFPGCQTAALQYSWTGDSSSSTGRLNLTDCAGFQVLAELDDVAVEVVVKDATVIWTVPLTSRLRAGTTLTSPTAGSSPAANRQVFGADLGVATPVGDRTDPGSSYRVRSGRSVPQN